MGNLAAIVLFLFFGYVYADETSSSISEADFSKKYNVTTMGFGGSYSGSPDKKTIILSPDRKKIIAEEIYSPNKKFAAFADLERKIITIKKIDWQGNIGWSNKYWSMDGYFELLGLSNDGEHLVVGRREMNVLPSDYKKDQVLLSFFKSGQLINQARLNQLITDFSKLQRVDTGYRWGKYLGLNAAGYFVVENIEGSKILFDMSSGKPAQFKSEKSEKLANWKAYRDIMRCYEFQYPDNYFLREILAYDGMPTGDGFLESNKTGWVIDISTDDNSGYHDTAKMSFEEFAIKRAKIMFSADGPNGSRYAADITKKEVFTNSHNLKSVEIYLLEVVETYSEDEEATIEKRTRGPVYAVSIAQPDEPYFRALFLKFNDEDENLLSEKKIRRKIVDTVRILR